MLLGVYFRVLYSLIYPFITTDLLRPTQSIIFEVFSKYCPQKKFFMRSNCVGCLAGYSLFHSSAPLIYERKLTLNDGKVSEILIRSSRFWGSQSTMIQRDLSGAHSIHHVTYERSSTILPYWFLNNGKNLASWKSLKNTDIEISKIIIEMSINDNAITPQPQVLPQVL